jgi:hypothetical protein
MEFTRYWVKPSDDAVTKTNKGAKEEGQRLLWALSLSHSAQTTLISLALFSSECDLTTHRRACRIP